MAGKNVLDKSNVITGKTVDASNNLIVRCSGYSTLGIHVTATSSLAGVCEGTFDDLSVTAEASADWFPLPSLITDTAAVTENLPGATITPDDDDVVHAALMGSKWARFRRTAGSGTVSYSLHTTELSDIQQAAGGGVGDATAANQSTMITSLQLLDDAVFVDDAAFTPGTSKGFAVGFQADETATDSVDEGDFGVPRMTLNRRVITAGQMLDDAAFTPATDHVTPMGAVADQTTPDSVDEGDVGALRMTLDRFLNVLTEVESGNVRVGGVQTPIKFASITATAAGDNQVVTAVASKKIRVLSYVIVADAAEVVQWQDDAGANLSGTISLAANGGIVCGYNPGGWFETASGQGLDLNNVGGADVDGHCSYIEV